MEKHAHEYSAVWLNDCMFGNIDILKFAKKYGIKRRIIHAHNSWSMGGGISRLFRHRINSWRLRFYVTDYWACSNLAGNWSYPNDIVKKRLIKVIPNAVDIEKFSVKNEVRQRIRKSLNAEEKIIFGHVGRFHFQKNHLFLIDIFDKIHRINNNSVLVLIGSGEDENKVKQKIEEYGIEDAVQFLGTRKDIEELYQAMDVFLLPSLFEGLPVVMIEAQAAGLPCFVADTITKESDISGNVKFYPLSLEPEQWAKNIMHELAGFMRKNMSDIVSSNGYSIDKAAMELFIELKDGKR